MKLSACVAVLGSLFLISPTVRAQEAKTTPDLVTKSTFQLVANPKFLTCLSASKGTPIAKVTVSAGKQNDTLTLSLSHVKPNLGFDLFTIQRTNLLANGTVDPNFTNFGLAWYQSDVQADKRGNAKVTIQTILVDEIFGFDPTLRWPLPTRFTLESGLTVLPMRLLAASPVRLRSTASTMRDLTR